jgi:hypothetical protein
MYIGEGSDASMDDAAVALESPPSPLPVHVIPTEDGTAATAPAPAPAPMPALSPVTVDSSHVVIPGDLQDYLLLPNCNLQLLSRHQ